ncbi:MAG: hypothetical protein GX335_01290, partial [Firmicutes bacterium]|nr:hypothetical protein [Bacillota bacterium]
MGVIKISSKNNEQIRAVKRLQHKKYRDQTGQFYIEGVRITEEALPIGLIESFFYVPQLLQTSRGRRLVSRAKSLGFPVYECTKSTFAEITDTVTSQG